MNPAFRRLAEVALVCAAALPSAHAADESFDLGTVSVTGRRAQVGEMPTDQAGSVVTRRDMEQFGRDTVGEAVTLLPGVTLSSNSRNESLVYVRGFDARQVPLFIDGVPVYVPYDGYVDFGRFGTYDLAAIQLAKGFSSIAYGPNALGGAINLVSRKPSKAFEGDAVIGMADGGDRKAGINLGTRRAMWYAQAGLSYRAADGFRLSSDFRPTATENGGLRENADHRDRKLSFKVGLTPDARDEYALSFYKQEGRKGQPPTTGTSGVRFWRWPYWDKESLYFVSRTALGSTETLKLRLYHDRFDNEVDSFSDASYSVLRTSGQGSVSTGRSIYHDRTTGGAVELESQRLANHLLRAVVQQKVDKHTEVDGDAVLNTRYKDTVSSIGIEDLITLAPAWELSLGVARHRLRPDSVFGLASTYALPRASSATNLQAGLFHDLDHSSRAYLTLARKTRLPTLKDRYSQRLGSYVENPDLGPETSLNAELGFQGRPFASLPDLALEAAIFQNRVKDKIQSAFVADGVSCSEDTPCQMRNVGRVRIRGLELGARTMVRPWLELGGNFTILDQKNVSNRDTRMTGVPDRRFFGFVVIRPAEAVSMQATVEHESRRWVSDTATLSGVTVLGLKVAWNPMPALTLEAGLDNALDENFELDAGFPAPGRTWFAQVRWVF